MEKEYFFGIDKQRVGPLNEGKIKDFILDGKITHSTPSWCKGMSNWMAFSSIPELSTKFSKLIDSQLQPPPLTNVSEVTPPPLTKQSDSLVNLTPLEQSAYKFVSWCFRPWRGRRNFVHDYVSKNPKRALPVSAATLCMVALIIFGFFQMNSSTPSMNQSAGQQIQQPLGVAPANWQAQHRAWQDMHNYNQGIIDDVYKYNRDAGDRRDETYRRANYDWYRDND